MTKQELIHAIDQSDIRAHMKAALSITSPMCELETALVEASNLLRETLVSKLEQYCTEAGAGDGIRAFTQKRP